MPQSLARFHTHLVFSTKYREPMLHDGIRDNMHRYIAVIIKTFGGTPVLINSVEDHIHLLFDLGRHRAICDAVEDIKRKSSKWIKTQGADYATFRWQAGYGAFAVSAESVPHVREYIANQREHHNKEPFPEEYRGLLEQNSIPYDEKYVWD